MRRILHVFLPLITIGSLVVVPLSASAAGGYDDGMPGQATADAATLQWGEGKLGGWQAWADRFANGDLSKRPYVSDFSIVHADTSSTTIFSGKTNSPTVTNGFASDTPQTGDLGVEIQPFNTCSAGTAEQQGVCYATPNRVAFNVVYCRSDCATDVGYNLASPNNHGSPLTLSTPLQEGDQFDITIHLGQIGSSLRWTWLEGSLGYWNVTQVPGATSIDPSDTVVHLRASWGDVVGIDENNHKVLNSSGQLVTWSQADRTAFYRCTATPIDSCNVNWSDTDGKQLSGVFSLDTTLSPIVQGAVFATTSAIFGYADVQQCLSLDSGPGVAPSIQYQVAAPHFLSDHTTVRTGDLHAWIPAAALMQCYQLPVDTTDISAALTAVEAQKPAGDTALAAPTFTTKTAAVDGSDAVDIAITGMTFSARKPSLKLRQARPVVSATLSAAKVLRVATTYAPGTCAHGGCAMTVYGKVTTKTIYPYAQTVCSKFGTGRLECRVVGPAVNPATVGRCVSQGLAKTVKDVSSCYRAKSFGQSTAVSSYGSALSPTPVESSAGSTMTFTKTVSLARGDRVFVKITRTRDNKVLAGSIVTLR